MKLILLLSILALAGCAYEPRKRGALIDRFNQTDGQAAVFGGHLP